MTDEKGPERADFETPDDTQASTPKALLVLFVAAAAVVVVSMGLVLTWAPLHWPLGGIYVRLMGATLVTNLVCLLVWNPKLIGRRAIPGAGIGAPWLSAWAACGVPV